MTKIEFKNLPDTTTPLNAENLNLLQDNVEDAIDSITIELDDTASTSSTNGVENQAITNYVNDSVSGDLVVDSIRTKNLFDKTTLVQGDIVDAFPTLRITSRQVIWLEVGTYTANTNLTSTYQWGIQIQNVGTLPLSSYPTYIYETGWQTTGTTEKTFTINTAGWYNLMIRRSDNGTFTDTDLANIFSSNYQLEKGEEATPYTPYQNLNNSSSGWTSLGNTVYFKKCGNIITVRGYSAGTVALSANAYKTLATLPPNVKPSMDLGFPFTRIGGTDPVGIVRVGANGYIDAYSTTSGTYWAFTITYIL